MLSIKKKIAGLTLVFGAFLVLASGIVSAQDYVLTARGDSLTGEVRPLFYGAEKRVQLIADDKEKTTYSIFQVRAFSSEGELYHPVKGERGYEFMKLITPGYLSLYAFQLENQSRFDGLLLKKMDGEFLVVPNLGFKKYVSRFLEDCPAVVAGIDDGTLGKRDLDAIIETYNTCIESRTPNLTSEAVTHRQQVIKVWTALEEKIREKEFDSRKDALDMVAEIRQKLERGETIPNFLSEGLKSALRDTGLAGDVDSALNQTK